MIHLLFMESHNIDIRRDQRARAAAFNASLPPCLRGALVIDDPEYIRKEDSRMRYDAGELGLPLPKEQDANDHDWDDTNDFNGVFDSEMPVGLDGRPLDADEQTRTTDQTEDLMLSAGALLPFPHIENIETEEIIANHPLDSDIPSLVRCGLNSDRLNSEDTRSLLDFAKAWKNKTANPQKPSKLVYVYDTLGNPDVHDYLMLIDSTGKHEISVDAFDKALTPYEREPKLPYLLDPDSKDNAKLFLRIMNSISIDGYKGNFGELVVVDMDWFEIGSVKIETKSSLQQSMSNKSNGKKHLELELVEANQHPVIAKPKIAIPAETGSKSRFVDEVVEICKNPGRRRGEFNLLFLNNSIRLEQTDHTVVIYCEDYQLNALTSLSDHLNPYLGCHTIKINKKSAHLPSQKVLQPA